ncbi:phytanoyl-CoA dioxygenase family protein [Burkholderia ubonensis]|uniref:phytanoyl-CoA dioxygenase family protein n=1 Tax=Burkholderia ubonensis TaxID=101571 RepID=UPI0007540772|nr:phytanoyl-CoA dioxygenase family protein [Burkholderia ubonensis]KVC82114.1 hypothetical protein WI75_06660 [Burkholderia ubonensis]KVL77579.1 hypothetical protein WJ48_31435 [Burkholderia ubonensis]KVL81379.1 hypothetical protein WJ49_02615 [Burkholderia ubonensis]KVL83586.1 hypothetical protein WJ50_22710 [Burkholderia ubonensis]
MPASFGGNVISNKSLIDPEFGREHGIREKAFSPALLHVLDIVNQGYTVVQGTSSVPVRCDRARAAFERFKQSNSKVVERHTDRLGHCAPVTNLHCGLPELMGLLTAHTLVTEIADHFLGEAVVLSSTYAETGSARLIERDAPTFTTEPDHLHLNVWFALEDMDADNGALTVIPNAQLAKQDDFRNFHPRDVRVKKGDVLILHPDMPYGETLASDSDRTRHSIVMRLTPPNVRIEYRDTNAAEYESILESSDWTFCSAGSRRFFDHQSIRFAHGERYPIKDLSL